MNMNYFYSNPSSNIIPCWQNNNVSVAKINTNCLSMQSEKSLIEQISYVRERIISVQEQRQTREEIPLGITCKSNHTDKCYAEYNLNNLRQGFGQLKHIRYETTDPGNPSLVTHSSTLEKNENDMVILTNLIVKELGKNELRKRFAIVHTEKYIYIIGGYIYDAQIPARKKPSHDYKFDIQTRNFIPTQALPNGAIGFGLCVDEDCIYAVGGNDLYNRPLSDCYCLNTRDSNETWMKLPSLPAPTTGPGVGVYEGQLHCIGGYDLLGNKSIAHGEYLLLRYPHDKQWRYAPELDHARARPLVFILPDESIRGQSVYVAGGFNVHPTTHKPYIVPDLQLFNETSQRWQRLTTIPNLQLSHVLSFNDNKLHVSETIESPVELPTVNILRSFDLGELQWTNRKNDDNHKRSLKDQNSVQTSLVKLPMSPPSNAKDAVEIKTIQNDQVSRLELPSKTQTSTLKMANSKIQQNNIRSDDNIVDVPKTRQVNQQLIGQNKTLINTKRLNLSTSRSLNH